MGSHGMIDPPNGHGAWVIMYSGYPDSRAPRDKPKQAPLTTKLSDLQWEIFTL